MICIRHENGKVSIHFTVEQASKLREICIQEAKRLIATPPTQQDNVRLLTDLCDALAAPIPPVLLREEHRHDHQD
jgi:hypothetical protein